MTFPGEAIAAAVFGAAVREGHAPWFAAETPTWFWILLVRVARKRLLWTTLLGLAAASTAREQLPGAAASAWLWGAALVVMAYREVSRRREYMGSVDAQLVNTTSLATSVHNMMVFNGRMTHALYLQGFRTHWLQLRRFRQRAVRRQWRWSYWEEDPDFDLERHVVRHAERVDRARAEAYLREWTSTEWDMAHPMWSAHVFEDFDGGGGQGEQHSAVVFRFHHAMFDGVAFFRTMFLGMEMEAAAPTSAKKRKGRGGAAPSRSYNLITPVHKIMAMQTDPPSALKPAEWLDVATPRTTLWSRCDDSHASIEAIKRIGKATGTTVNDVLMAALAGSLRRVAAESAATTAPIDDVWCVIWISLRDLRSIYKPASELPIEFGNGGLSMVYVRLPLSIDDPRARLDALHSRVEELKRSVEPLVGNALLRLAGFAPPAIVKPIWDSIACVCVLASPRRSRRRAPPSISTTRSPRARARSLSSHHTHYTADTK